MRRVLFAVIGLLVLLVAGFIAVPFMQSRALGQRLAADVATLRANVIARTPAPRNPQHDNGFACLSGMLKVTPRDLTPFNIAAPGTPGDLSAWVRGDEPLETVPPELDARAQALAGWADETRACGSSMKLQYVVGLEPWDDVPRHSQVVMALTRFTGFEVRRLLADKQPQLALERCNATLAFTLDQSHLNLVGAMLAVSSLRTLAPQCAAAFNALSAEEKKNFAPQWVVLSTRLASTKEIFEVERLTASLLFFGPLVDTEGIPRPKEVASMGSTAVSRLLARQLWGTWDARMRALVDAAGTAAEREKASKEVDAAFTAWWLPMELTMPASYERFALRLDEGRLILSVLQWLGNGATGALPEGATRVEAGVQWKDFDGKTYVIPVVP